MEAKQFLEYQYGIIPKDEQMLINPLFLVKVMREYAEHLQLLQPEVRSSCKHENIIREDGLDECLDCGARNY